MYNGLFSIIVPIYKVEEYLRECIDSLILQSYSNIEIILVDDGSPDNCSNICDEYAVKDSRIKVIHKENGGVVSARQIGSTIATGEYIVCVDGDDWIDENYIQKFAEIIDIYKPDMVMCGRVDVYNSYNEERVLPYRKGYYSKEHIIKEIFPILIQTKNATYFSPSIWAKVYRVELYHKFHQTVNEKIKIGEDSAFVIPCIYHANSIFVMEDCIYYYRQNLLSVTKQKKAFGWDGPELLYRQLELHVDIEKFDFKEQLYRKITHELFSVVVSQFYRKDSYKVVAKDIKKNLDNIVYRTAINESNFSVMKAKLMRLVLKYKCIRIIWLFSKIK